MPKCELCANEAKPGIPFCAVHQPDFWGSEPPESKRKMVLVELDADGVIRVFRTVRTAISSPAWEAGRVARCEKAVAVGQIRRRVFERAEYRCERCAECVSWDSGELNEIRFKGKGGEQSLDNCEVLCHNCHQGSTVSVHGNRKAQWSKGFE